MILINIEHLLNHKQHCCCNVFLAADTAEVVKPNIAITAPGSAQCIDSSENERFVTETPSIQFETISNSAGKLLYYQFSMTDH